MKRRKLLKHLKKHGCEFLREGGDPTIYSKPGTNLQTSVPRHQEIEPYLVKKICKDVDIIAPLEK